MNFSISARTVSLVLVIGCSFFLTIHPVLPDEDQKPLKKQFHHLYSKLKKQSNKNIDLIDGPKEVSMGRGGKGKQWLARTENITFKISIKDTDEIDLGIGGVIDRLEHIPVPYRHAFEIVSDKNEDGVAIYADLNGAAAHGSKKYINIVPSAGPHVITHEAGHSFDQYAIEHGLNVRKQWKKAIESDDISVSGYGDHVEHEDLAEFAQVYAACLAAGRKHLKKLKQLSPARFRTWRKILSVKTKNKNNNSSKQTTSETSPLRIKSALDNGLSAQDIQPNNYLKYVQTALDTLIEHGTDRYGSNTSEHLLVSVIDVRSKKATKEFAGDKWRVDRLKRRNPGASDLLHDQALIRTMDRVSDLTGNQKYTRFADQYMTYATNHLVADGDPSFWWGWHRRYDVFKDEKHGHSGGHHEIHATETINWNRLHEVNPDATLAEIKHIWKKHVVNKETGEINRHDTGSSGLSFIMTSGAFIQAFAHAYRMTGKKKWLKRATLLMNYNSRHVSDAGLLADAPNNHNRFDGNRSLTTFPGLYAGSLLTTYQITEKKTFLGNAIRHLKNWYRHAYDTDNQHFWGSLKLDGTPVKGPRVTGGYKQYEPRGHVDLWNPYALGYEHPLEAALSYARAARITEDQNLLKAAKNWASLIHSQLPPDQTREDTWYDGYSKNWSPYGTYAEHYGKVLFVFLHLYTVTGNKSYLTSAKKVANHAIAHLWYDGLFRGHPKKPFYEAVDGVGLFMEALTRLAQHHRSSPDKK